MKIFQHSPPSWLLFRLFIGTVIYLHQILVLSIILICTILINFLGSDISTFQIIPEHRESVLLGIFVDFALWTETIERVKQTQILPSSTSWFPSNIGHEDFQTSSGLLRHAQTTPPVFWNGLDWRALVESRIPNIGKLRGQHCFLLLFSPQKKS